MAKKRTRKKKLATNKKRVRVAARASSTKQTIPTDKTSDPVVRVFERGSAKTKQPSVGIFGYDISLIYQDLLKTFFVTIIIIAILLVVWFRQRGV